MEALDEREPACRLIDWVFQALAEWRIRAFEMPASRVSPVLNSKVFRKYAILRRQTEVEIRFRRPSVRGRISMQLPVAAIGMTPFPEAFFASFPKRSIPRRLDENRTPLAPSSEQTQIRPQEKQ